MNVTEASELIGPKPPSPPSNGRKLMFWLLMGMFSVVFVEVPAGSTMFPFFTVWGLLVVIPLYLLHIVFLAAVVFRFGRPIFWTLFAAGMLFGMYEAYITKVVWTSFRPEGPIANVGGVAIFETILLVFFLHPILAFVVPLFFVELVCTSSAEIASGLPQRLERSIRRRPIGWLCLLMAFLGCMQFINSPSVVHSLLSGAGNSAVMAAAVWWWRHSGGAVYPLRDLLPGRRGCKVFGIALLLWYGFWGITIKPRSIPGILSGQLIIWASYAVLLWIFIVCLRKSAAKPRLGGDGDDFGTPESSLHFSWYGFVVACAVATGVTALCRLALYRFALVQVMLFFSLYVVVGVSLFVGTLRFISRPSRDTGSGF